MIKRIGLLTSGGDCQALNATMRGVVKGLANALDEMEVYGFEDGYKGLIYGKYRLLSSRDFSGILTQGGTIIGTSRQPFKLMRVPDEKGLDKVEAMKQIKTLAKDMNKETAIIALTANAVSGAREMFIREGFDGFIAKPINTSDFERVMLRVLPAEKISYDGRGGR